jgi:hypothetical protein
VMHPALSRNCIEECWSEANWNPQICSSLSLKPYDTGNNSTSAVQSVDSRQQAKLFVLLTSSRSFLPWLTIHLWRRRLYIPPKLRFIFKGLQGAISVPLCEYQILLKTLVSESFFCTDIQISERSQDDDIRKRTSSLDMFWGETDCRTRLTSPSRRSAYEVFFLKRLAHTDWICLEFDRVNKRSASHLLD